MPRALRLDHLKRPVEVPGGYEMSLTALIGFHHVRASWIYVDGVPLWNTHVDTWLLSVLDEIAAATGGPYRPQMALNSDQPASPAVSIFAELVQATGTMMIAREKVEDARTGGDLSGAATLYFDTESGAVHKGAELLEPEAVRDIQARILGVPTGIAAASPPALADVVLNPAGELTVTAELPGKFKRSLTLGANETRDALSDYGRRALAQLSTPSAERPKTSPALRHISCDLVPCAALTYDDGPDGQTTPQLLGILKEMNVQATFFMTGSNATAYPATARQVAAAGYAIGNHTFSHPDLTKLSVAGVKEELERADAAIQAATGSVPKMMRPPYGAADAAVQTSVPKPLILWAVDSLDWQSKNPAVFVPKILREITPGAIVLMHDVHPTTASGQTKLISELQQQRYHLVSVPQLLEGTRLVPGHIYRSRPPRQ
jgi:peptidoglycan/xylan/chitin deacetylase (PgdA/CDA1 family)